MFAMAALAAGGGASAAVVVAIGGGVALTVDLPVVWRRLSVRFGRTQSATVTPFQNAT
jgi:hypothetical protein